MENIARALTFKYDSETWPLADFYFETYQPQMNLQLQEEYDRCETLYKESSRYLQSATAESTEKDFV